MVNFEVSGATPSEQSERGPTATSDTRVEPTPPPLQGGSIPPGPPATSAPAPEAGTVAYTTPPLVPPAAGDLVPGTNLRFIPGTNDVHNIKIAWPKINQKRVELLERILRVLYYTQVALWDPALVDFAGLSPFLYSLHLSFKNQAMVSEHGLRAYLSTRVMAGILPKVDQGLYDRSRAAYGVKVIAVNLLNGVSASSGKLMNLTRGLEKAASLPHVHARQPAELPGVRTLPGHHPTYVPAERQPLVPAPPVLDGPDGTNSSSLRQSSNIAAESPAIRTTRTKLTKDGTKKAVRVKSAAVKSPVKDPVKRSHAKSRARRSGRIMAAGGLEEASAAALPPEVVKATEQSSSMESEPSPFVALAPGIDAASFLAGAEGYWADLDRSIDDISRRITSGEGLSLDVHLEEMLKVVVLIDPGLEGL